MSKRKQSEVQTLMNAPHCGMAYLITPEIIHDRNPFLLLRYKLYPEKTALHTKKRLKTAVFFNNLLLKINTN